jgi:hypothetical protein
MTLGETSEFNPAGAGIGPSARSRSKRGWPRERSLSQLPARQGCDRAAARLRYRRLEINPILKPHQRAIVRWAIAGGRRAIFAAFGLGKSVIQIEIVRIIMRHAGGRGLIIVIPLGVRQEFMRDAAMLGVPIKFIRRMEECADLGSST